VQPRRPPPAHVAEEHDGGGHHEEHCPGHGPTDPPHPQDINWWHGLLGVNNEKAQSDRFVDKLLWRYENKTNACDVKNQPPPFLASVVNFLVLIGIIVRFGRKPLAAALVKRKQDIMHEIDTATRLKEEAERRLDDYERKFENIEDTFEELKADFAAQAEVERSRILAEAEERRGRMLRDAETRVEQERKEAQAALLKEAVLGAARAAEELLTQRAEQADAARLAEEYLASIGPAMAAERRAGVPRLTGGAS
jgi:F-type H+-transporting ATPase subunit b